MAASGKRNAAGESSVASNTAPGSQRVTGRPKGTALRPSKPVIAEELLNVSRVEPVAWCHPFESPNGEHPAKAWVWTGEDKPNQPAVSTPSSPLQKCRPITSNGRQERSETSADRYRDRDEYIEHGGVCIRAAATSRNRRSQPTGRRCAP